MNIIQIAGHLGADAESRVTPSGQKVINLRLAARTRRRKKDARDSQGGQQEERDDDTIWYRITIWGDRYDKMVPYLKKGSAVIIYGELQKPEIWTNRDGQPQVSLEVTAFHVQFSPFGKGGSEREGGENSGYARQGFNQQPAFGEQGRNMPFAGTPQPAYGQASGHSAEHDEEPPF
jgi:single-strand DNA-binding protein